MAHAIIAPNIDFYGLQLNGKDPIPEDLKQYLSECGVSILQKNGYVSVYGEYKIDKNELKKRFPQFFDKYTVTTSTEYTFQNSKPLHYFHAKSNSKVTGEEKHWLEKDVDSQYTINQAAADVFRGTVAKMLFGDALFSKIKFDIENRAVVTRIKYADRDGDNIYDLADFLYYMIDKGRNLDSESQLKSALMNLIVLGLLTENRALSAFQLGCEIGPEAIEALQDDDSTAAVVANVFPFKFWNFPKSVTENAEVIAFEELAPQILNDFYIAYNIIFEDDVHWNNANVTSLRDLEETEAIENSKLILTEGISQDNFNEKFIATAEKIAENDFEICNIAKEKILQDLKKDKSTFSAADIDEHIIPQIDAIVTTLRNNVSMLCNYHTSLKPENQAAPSPRATI